MKPAESVFVGDRVNDDIAGAKGVGMRAVLTHEFREEDVPDDELRPDAVIDRLEELPGVIERLRKDEPTG